MTSADWRLNQELWLKWGTSERGMLEAWAPLLQHDSIGFSLRGPRAVPLFRHPKPTRRCRWFGHLPVYDHETPRVCSRCGWTDAI